MDQVEPRSTSEDQAITSKDLCPESIIGRLGEKKKLMREWDEAQLNKNNHPHTTQNESKEKSGHGRNKSSNKPVFEPVIQNLKTNHENMEKRPQSGRPEAEEDCSNQIIKRESLDINQQNLSSENENLPQEQQLQADISSKSRPNTFIIRKAYSDMGAKKNFSMPSHRYGNHQDKEEIFRGNQVTIFNIVNRQSSDTENPRYQRTFTNTQKQRKVPAPQRESSPANPLTIENVQEQLRIYLLQRKVDIDRKIEIIYKRIFEANEQRNNATRRFEQNKKRYKNAMYQLYSIERTESNEQKIMDKKQHVNRLKKIYLDSIRQQDQIIQQVQDLYKNEAALEQQLRDNHKIMMQLLTKIVKAAMLAERQQ